MRIPLLSRWSAFATAVLVGSGVGCIPWTLTVDGPPTDYSPERHGLPTCDADSRRALLVDGVAGAAAGAGGAAAALLFLFSASSDNLKNPRYLFFPTGVAAAGLGHSAMHFISLRKTRAKTPSVEQ